MAKILQLNIKDFEDEVNNYLSSHNGQKYVRDIIASGGNTTGGVSIDDAIRAAEELKRLIQTFASMEFSISQYSIYNNVHNIDIGMPIDNGDGTYNVELLLPDDISRPSLNPKNQGAYNIVSLFIHGWNDKSGKIKKLHGLWNGNMVGARVSNPPMRFAADAVDFFNMQYKSVGCYAELGDDYK